MKHTLPTLSLLAAAVSIVAAGESKIKKTELPPAVQSAFRAQYPNARVKELARETDDGKTVYEVSVDDAGVRRDVLYSPEGQRLLEETTIRAQELPEVVAKALTSSRFGKAKTLKVERLQEENQPPKYELLVEMDGKQHELVFDATGALTNEEAKEVGDKDAD